MQLLDRLKRWVGFPRSFEAVAAELADGLRDGTITLGPRDAESGGPGHPVHSEKVTPVGPAPMNGSVAGSREPIVSDPSSE